MEKEPNISYSDRFGRRNREYVSLGCDLLPVLDGRTPIQAYSDFMREFKKAFEGYLGIVITVSTHYKLMKISMLTFLLENSYSNICDHFFFSGCPNWNGTWW